MKIAHVLRSSIAHTSSHPVLPVTSPTSTINPPVLPANDDLQGIWVVPKFNPITITNELEMQLASAGGSVEQSYMYWDHKSARDWLSISNQPDYRAAESNLPYSQVAEEIAWALQEGLGPEKKALEMIAIGPGDAAKEVCLVQDLVKHRDLIHHIQLDLLDISQPLLVDAYKTAKQVFQDNPWVSVWAVQGDMFHLTQYDQLLHRSARRPCLITMMGGTLQTLQNEPQFIQNNLGPFKRGNLLLIDVSTIHASVENPDEIYSKDPRLSGKIPAGWDQNYKKFLAGPLKRHYQENLEDIHFETILDLDGCCVPKSYAVELRAKVNLRDGTTKEFSLMRFVRYHKNELIRMFASKGWFIVDTWDFGPSKDRCVYLFRKQ